MAKPMPETTITVGEAAERYGISAPTLRRYINAGRLTAWRMGPKNYRLDPTELEHEIFTPMHSKA